MLIKAIRKCRVCGSRNLVPVLSLGSQYVTNFVEGTKDKVYKSPLELVLCDVKKGGCGLLQLKHTFNHDVLYRKYWYRSGISTSMVGALADVAHSAEKLAKPSKGDVLIDIGSNDGTLLKQYGSKSTIRVGFEPSNLWRVTGKDRNMVIIHDYFNYASFRKKLGSRKAKAITSVAMFYDLDDPNSFVEDICKCLDRNGIWIIQMNYLGLMLENNTFDNISHEHLEYYSFMSLEKLLQRHGLEIADVELNGVNGGSFRCYVRHRNGHIRGFAGAEARLRRQRAWERRAGLDGKLAYLRFAGGSGESGPASGRCLRRRPGRARKCSYTARQQEALSCCSLRA